VGGGRDSGGRLKPLTILRAIHRRPRHSPPSMPLTALDATHRPR
jgi:hypothetical protein